MSFNGESVYALAHDYETTGVDAGTCGVLQAALVICTLQQDGSYEIHDSDCMLLNPGCEIHPEASKIHGYYAHDLIGEPEWHPYLSEQMATVNELGVKAVIGYNSGPFDNRIAMRAGFKAPPSIDLMKAARKFKTEHKWPSAKLVNFYEHLMGRPMEKAHDALADVTATLDTIQAAMALAKVGCLDEFMIWMKGDDGTPEMKIGFGKHKGSKLKNLEGSYIRWLLSTDCEVPYSDELRQGLEACLK